ncbi:MAG: 4-alpha-glucanotransferase, partial [Polyangiaceae bacterium]
MRRQAGMVIPLSAIRSRRDWGIGQVTDLPLCAAWALRAGQRLLQVLPPHEISDGETSPYGAMTAFGIDPVYADIDAIEDLDPGAIGDALGADGRLRLERSRSTGRVDYESVRSLKKCALDAAFSRFYEREWSRATPRATKLAAFIESERSW